MEKQSDYWHISNTDLTNLYNSVYSITSNPSDKLIVKNEYKNLLKFIAVPSVEEILKHAEMIHGEGIRDKASQFINNSVDEYRHLSLKELDNLVKESMFDSFKNSQ